MELPLFPSASQGECSDRPQTEPPAKERARGSPTTGAQFISATGTATSDPLDNPQPALDVLDGVLDMRLEATDGLRVLRPSCLAPHLLDHLTLDLVPLVRCPDEDGLEKRRDVRRKLSAKINRPADPFQIVLMRLLWVHRWKVFKQGRQIQAQVTKTAPKVAPVKSRLPLRGRRPVRKHSQLQTVETQPGSLRGLAPGRTARPARNTSWNIHGVASRHRRVLRA